MDTLSEEYKASTATAHKEASSEKHFTKHDTSLVFQRQAALNTHSAVTHVAKHAKISKDVFEKKKEEIEGELFELFKDKPAWKTADIAVCLPPRSAVLPDYSGLCVHTVGTSFSTALRIGNIFYIPRCAETPQVEHLTGFAAVVRNRDQGAEWATAGRVVSQARVQAG